MIHGLRIGLIDIDSHNFPSLPLMKISAYHKSEGNNVEFYEPLHTHKFDTVYMSKVFTFSKDYQFPVNADKVIKGGTGYSDFDAKLDDKIEHIYPDYGLYGITDTAYGFLTRGCPRKCGFCIVSEKEGAQSVKTADIKEFWRGQRNIKLCDPNLLACSDANEMLTRLAQTKAAVDFTQGIDARLLTDENISLIKKINIKTIHFAWDNADDKYTPENIKNFIVKTGWKIPKVAAYVLTNYNSSFEQDYERVMKLREIGVNPFVMIYEPVPKSPRQRIKC